MNTQDRILITGSTGMVGGALKRLLHAGGYTELLTPTHEELELRCQASVRDYFKKHQPDFIFHLAARVGGIHANRDYPAEFIYSNTQMQCNVMQAAQDVGVKKLLFPGSACTYPKLAQQPVIESALLDGAIEPTNIAYAAAKINGIVMAQSYAKQYGMKVVIPMPTNAYGVGDNFDPSASHVIPALMKRFHEAKLEGKQNIELWGSGTPLREFIYVDDFADALVFLMHRYDSYETINLGTMQEISIFELAKKIAEVVGYEGELTLDQSKPDGAPRKCLDSNKLFALGWKPKTNLADGLKMIYNHHFSEPV